MGLAPASRARYESALKKMFPRGEYWDKQFADPESDASLFVLAKLDALIRFRARMGSLLNESRPESTEELIADWERVLLGALNPDKTLAERRLLLKSHEDECLNRAKLQEIAALYGFTIHDIIFPYRPAFFGHTRFNRRIGGGAAFSVLYITPRQDGFMDKAWTIIKQDHPVKSFSRMRFGINRLVYFPIGNFNLANQALFENILVRFMVQDESWAIIKQDYPAKSFSGMRFGVDRLAYSPIRNFNFISRALFERALIRFMIQEKQPFKDFEQAITNKLLANHIPYFFYEERTL